MIGIGGESQIGALELLRDVRVQHGHALDVSIRRSRCGARLSAAKLVVPQSNAGVDDQTLGHGSGAVPGIRDQIAIGIGTSERISGQHVVPLASCR